MGEKGYDVLKLVEQGERCYVSTDYIRGTQMARLLRREPDLEKAQLFRWMKDLLEQLERFHRCRGNPCYQYVNPYSAIISGEDGLCLLDISSDDQHEILRQMRRRPVREHFLSPENQYYQRAEPAEDIYGIGRTLQYMLTMARPEPPLTVGEERKLKKIISKCLDKGSKRGFSNVQEISDQFSRVYKKSGTEKKNSNRRKKKGKRRWLPLFLAALSAAGIGWAAFYACSDRSPQETEVKQGKAFESEEGKNGDRGAEFAFELAMLYFLELRDYERSGMYFAIASGEQKTAKEYEDLSDYLKKGSISGDADPETLLRRMEEHIPDTEDARYYFCLLRGYEQMDMRESAEDIIRIGEHCLALDGWKTWNGSEEREKELRLLLADAYGQEGEWQRAADCCTEAVRQDLPAEEKEQIFQKTALLYEKMGNMEKAVEICGQGIRETGRSAPLWLLLIRLQCKTPSVDREDCAQTVREGLKQLPELAQEEEFRKLQEEYGIRIEGEQIWVGE